MLKDFVVVGLVALFSPLLCATQRAEPIQTFLPRPLEVLSIKHRVLQAFHSPCGSLFPAETVVGLYQPRILKHAFKAQVQALRQHIRSLNPRFGRIFGRQRWVRVKQPSDLYGYNLMGAAVWAVRKVRGPYGFLVQQILGVLYEPHWETEATLVQKSLVMTPVESPRDLLSGDSLAFPKVIELFPESPDEVIYVRVR